MYWVFLITITRFLHKGLFEILYKITITEYYFNGSMLIFSCFTSVFICNMIFQMKNKSRFEGCLTEMATDKRHLSSLRKASLRSVCSKQRRMVVQNRKKSILWLDKPVRAHRSKQKESCQKFLNSTMCRISKVCWSHGWIDFMLLLICCKETVSLFNYFVFYTDNC